MPKSTPGRPLIGVIGLQNRSWAPPGAFNELFLAPGPLPRAIWSAPGAHFWPTWGPQTPQRVPRAHVCPPRRPSRHHFGRIFDGFWDAILLCAGCCLCACALPFDSVILRKCNDGARLDPPEFSDGARLDSPAFSDSELMSPLGTFENAVTVRD